MSYIRAFTDGGRRRARITCKAKITCNAILIADALRCIAFTLFQCTIQTEQETAEKINFSTPEDCFSNLLL